MGSTQPAASSAPPAPESFVTRSAETIQSGHLHMESGNWPPPPFIDEILTILSVASGTTRPRLAVRAANSSGMPPVVRVERADVRKKSRDRASTCKSRQNSAHVAGSAR